MCCASSAVFCLMQACCGKLRSQLLRVVIRIFPICVNLSAMAGTETVIRSKADKKPFNKSQWRTNRYSHKKKVEQFEDKRRKSALHKYYKELKKTQPSTGSKQQTEVCDSERTAQHQRHRDLNPFAKAEQELERRIREKEQLRAEKEKERTERAEALKQYKRDKTRKFLKLKQKTKKGQPVMAGRMELLLEKIQKAVG